MKRILTNLNSVVAIILAFVLVQMVGFLSMRNPLRVNLSGRAYYELSDKTLNLLDQLDQRVSVSVFFQEEHMLYADIENLLDEYQYHSRNIRVEFIDPARDPARTEKLKNQYGMDDEPQVVVFDIGDRSKVVRLPEIAEFVMEPGQREATFASFKGEQAFSSAIQSLMQEEMPKVYFLVGHGERRVNDFNQLSGYSKIGLALVNDNLELKELVLSGEKKIPDDAAGLVIAGPTKLMSSIEVEMIEEYLSRSGRVLVMIDALKETGLEPMLRRWGIGLRQDVVVDPENTLRGSDVHIRRFSDHPISINMSSIVQFILPRSIMPIMEADEVEGEDRPVVIPLLYTSEKSWSETQVEDSTARLDLDKGDLPGDDPERRLSLAVAVERGASQKMLDVQILPSRMVVFGDSDFVSNGSMVVGNQDLFMSAMNWLLDREEMMAIAPKNVEEVKLSLSRKQLDKLFWINVVGIPFIAVVIGVFVWLRRRK